VAIDPIPDYKVPAHSLPASKNKLVVAWIEIHKKELIADWQLAVNGKHPLPIKALE
jgi:hypothetical protein